MPNNTKFFDTNSSAYISLWFVTLAFTAYGYKAVLPEHKVKHLSYPLTFKIETCDRRPKKSLNYANP